LYLYNVRDQEVIVKWWEWFVNTVVGCQRCISSMFCCSFWISTFSFPVCLYLYSCSCNHLLTDFDIHKYFNWNCRIHHKILWLCVKNSYYSSLILITHMFCEEFLVILSLLIVLIPWLLKISLMLGWLFELDFVEE